MRSPILTTVAPMPTPIPVLTPVLRPESGVQVSTVGQSVDEACKDLVVVEEVVEVGAVVFDVTKIEELVKYSGAGASKVSSLGTAQSKLPEPSSKPIDRLSYYKRYHLFHNSLRTAH